MILTIPVGQNPTGTRLSSQRYDEVYRIASEHNFMIIEDDAYFYLQHRSNVIAGRDINDNTSRDSCLPGLRDLGRSFLSVDTDGRVIRLDTFTKVLAAGFRIGWITGAAELTRKSD